MSEADEGKEASVIAIVEGKKESIGTIVETIQQFFENLQLEIENWKISMEEFRDGTRVFIRFQVLIRKR